MGRKLLITMVHSLLICIAWQACAKANLILNLISIHVKQIFTLLLLTLAFGLHAQERYLDEIFDEVQVTEDVEYAANITVIPALQGLPPMQMPQFMDVYEPVGDTLTSRPLVLLFHTGNFLPQYANSSALGTRKDSAIVELANRFARMGYVTASVDYRLGWNPLAGTQVERTYQLINAAYRGVQDARTAVRYFRMNAAEMDNEYGINPDKIAMFGDGTGGYVTLASATLQDYNDIILTNTGDPIESFWYDPGDGSYVTMVIEAINGDPEAKNDGFAPDSTQLCVGHYPDYSSEFNFQMNTGGAMGSAEWLDGGDVPMVSFHCPHDAYAPYTTGIVVVPVTNEPVIEATGAYDIHAIINDQENPNNNEVFQSLELADDISVAANALNDGMDGLYPVLNNYVDGEPSEPFDSSPWQWWDVAITQAVDTANGTNIAATQLSLNPTMGPDEALPWIDIIQGYTAPRMAAALGLTETSSGVEDVVNGETFTVYPNPTNGFTTIAFSSSAPFCSLYSMDGRVVRQWPLIGVEGSFSVDLSTLTGGTYVVQIGYESQLVSIVR
tara:strand:+ start:3858 stop:5525 length:1668 start_codon:yes stop_codon:yes gene_type:complete